MGHLSPEQFVDLAEGMELSAASAHVAGCERCRQQLADVRAALHAVADGGGEVPEPSPMFWEHFSDRVRQAVAEEPVRQAPWWRIPIAWPISAAAAAALALAVALTVRTPATPPAADPAPAEQVVEVAAPVLDPDDASLGLLVDLATDIDWEAADVDLGAVAIATEQTFSEMNAAERSELHRLLSEALSGGSGV